MRNIRLIARLDVKAPNLVKGIQFEGLRKIGNPNDFALNYYLQGIDEILYIDIVASLYERNSLLSIIQEATDNVFVPITVGGGIRNIKDVESVLQAGADKVAINTAAIKRPEIISEVAKRFGSSCMVHSIEAKYNGNYWEALYDNGREHSYLNVVDWARQGEELGAGEILLTSVDCEGTGNGFDIELVKAITDVVSIPVIASGGMGNLNDIDSVVKYAKADAIAMASILHYDRASIDGVRKRCKALEIPVRSV